MYANFPTEVYVTNQRPYLLCMGCHFTGLHLNILMQYEKVRQCLFVTCYKFIVKQINVTICKALEPWLESGKMKRMSADCCKNLQLVTLLDLQSIRRRGEYFCCLEQQMLFYTIQILPHSRNLTDVTFQICPTLLLFKATKQN
jgi:hypothetical protein